MSCIDSKVGVAIITGASGQDGYFLTERLLRDGWTVHATTRRASTPDLEGLSGELPSRLQIHQIDLLELQPLLDLIKRAQPDEFYNLAGQSSVSQSFSDPLYTWQTNSQSVAHLLECVRTNSPHTRFYQASSTDMFGRPPGDTTVFNEDSALNPQSPYASAKAAAHLLCHSYREVYGLRIASGILSNHESHRRPSSFLSRKVVEHVSRLKQLPGGKMEDWSPLVLGNLKVQRDWGFAPDYVEGMCRILRQVEARAAITGNPTTSDAAADYRDYVLATGKTHAVWELVDSAFALAGFDLEWHLAGDDPSAWTAHFRDTRIPAVVVDRDLLRKAEPLIIRADSTRARNELGWTPHEGMDVFLRDMMTARPLAAAASKVAPASADSFIQER